jgi:hypothetical protein
MLSHAVGHALQGFQGGGSFRTEHLSHQLRAELIMAGRHRGMSRKNAALTHRLAIGIGDQVQIPTRGFPFQQSEG